MTAIREYENISIISVSGLVLLTMLIVIIQAMINKRPRESSSASFCPCFQQKGPYKAVQDDCYASYASQRDSIILIN